MIISLIWSRSPLELWKDADEEIPEHRDTIKRLATLKQGS